MQPLTVLDHIRIYAPRHGGHSQVDGLRPFVVAGNYNYRGYPLPDSSRSAVAGRGQVEDDITVRPGSFLVMISSVSDEAAGFKFNVWDKTSGAPLFNTMVRDTVGASAPIPTLGNRRLPNYLTTPWSIPDPGVLTVRIVNLATVANDLQLYLVFAEPTGGTVRTRAR